MSFKLWQIITGDDTYRYIITEEGADDITEYLNADEEVDTTTSLGSVVGSDNIAIILPVFASIGRSTGRITFE